MPLLVMSCQSSALMSPAADSQGQLDVIINSTATGFALLSKSGKEVYLGQLRGAITVYDTDSQQVLEVFRVRG